MNPHNTNIINALNQRLGLGTHEVERLLMPGTYVTKLPTHYGTWVRAKDLRALGAPTELRSILVELLLEAHESWQRAPAPFVKYLVGCHFGLANLIRANRLGKRRVSGNREGGCARREPADTRDPEQLLMRKRQAEIVDRVIAHVANRNPRHAALLSHCLDGADPEHICPSLGINPENYEGMRRAAQQMYAKGVDLEPGASEWDPELASGIDVFDAPFDPRHGRNRDHSTHRGKSHHRDSERGGANE